MANQVAARLSTSPCIKAGQGNPVRGIGSQKPAKKSEAAPAPTVRNPTRRPSYITVPYVYAEGESLAGLL